MGSWTGVRARLRLVPLPLAILLAIGAIEAGAWSVAVAPFQGPDEDTHYAYAQYVAETGYKPSPTAGHGALSTELANGLHVAELHALVGNVGARPAWSSADVALWQATSRSFGGAQRSDGSGPNSIAQNPPLYYYVQAIPYRVGLLFGADLFTRLALMRALDGLLFLVTVALVWLLAGEVFGRVRWLQTVAAGAVVLQPQLAFMAGVVNSDSLLIAEFSAAMLLATVILRRGLSPGRVAGLAAVCAAGALTHGRGLALLPAFCAVLALGFLRHRPERAQALRLLGISAAVLGAGLAALLLLTVAGGGGAAYGGEVGRVTTGNARPFNLMQFLSGVWQFYLPRLNFQTPALGPPYGYRQVYIENFFGTFGSLEVQFGRTTFDLIQDGAMIGLLGLYTALVTLRQRLVAHWHVALALASFFVFELGLLHYDSYRHLLLNPSDPIITGRYLLPLVALFGIAVAVTLRALPRRLGPIGGGALLSIGVILQLSGLGITLLRFYA